MKPVFFVKPALYLGVASLAFGACNNDLHENQKKPNIILILADDLGYNDLSYYRSLSNVKVESPPTSQTPNIDQLAKEGITFTDFYAGAAVCSPSRATLLSGRNATRVGTYNWIPTQSPMHFRAEELTIAELLKENEYVTAHFGKWHLTSDFNTQPGPLEQGFDYGFYTQNNAEPSHHNPVNFIRNNEALGLLEGYSSHLVVNEAINWLQKITDKDKPFYMNIWFHEPHEVCAAPEEFTSRHSYRKTYYGAIENMDAAIGKLMDYLNLAGLDQNTLIIFTSDNGSQNPNSNLPFNGVKCLNVEGGVRVPFIASWKDELEQGKLTNAIGNFTDILPTVLDITNSIMPSGRTYDGESIKSALYQPDEVFKRTTPIFFYRYFHDPVCMIREGDWVLLGYNELFDHTNRINIEQHAKFKPAPGEPRWSAWSFQENHMDAIPLQEVNSFRLYNIEDDPAQLHDLSGEQPQVYSNLKSKMLQLKNDVLAEGGDWFH